MLEKLRVVFTIPELRQKILLTLFLLAIYRIGFNIPLPIANVAVLEGIGGSGSFGDILSRVSVLSASNLQQLTIFGLGIMPYISASIVFQILGTVWKPLEELRKEGEAGRKKINEYTRYATVVLCLIQSYFFLKFASLGTGGGSSIDAAFLNDSGQLTLGWTVAAVLTMTCGTAFLMWIGEQIDEYGIGNGISLLIMAGILTSAPGAFSSLFANNSFTVMGSVGADGLEKIIVLLILFLAIVAGVVFITLGQRRIPMQSAKHVRGRRVQGGTRQYLPLRINQAGVMPIIFASSLLLIPSLLFSSLEQFSRAETPAQQAGVSGFFNNLFQELGTMFSNPSSLGYSLLLIGMIFFFCYFWTAITFNPKEMADNLKSHGNFIPGYRAGKKTADYLEKVMVRITYVGAAFLALIAVVPSIISGSMEVDPALAAFYGGTGMLIAVSVSFDLVQKIDGHLVMRNHRGLLE
ncbi:MAG: preprotein translocase subunit SecY [Pirellulaceae bacterium]|nr:preprotein translocase subunit SecY [Pirellulaceae bacterium]